MMRIRIRRLQRTLRHLAHASYPRLQLLRWWYQRPVRWRLTIAFLVVLAAIIGAFSSLLYARMQRSLLAQIDGSLSVAVSQAVATIDNENGLPAFQETEASLSVERQLSHAGYAVRLRRADGTLIQQFGSDAPEATQVAVGYTTLSDTAQRWRIYTQPLRINGASVAYLEAAQSLASADRALTSLQSQTLLGLPVTLLLAGMGGALLVDRALRPVDRMTRAAQAISAGDVQLRMGYTGPADELGRLAVTFDTMLDRLTEALVHERQFVADASHELRTPLAALKSRIGVALRQPRRADEYVAVLHSLEHDVDRLIYLSTDLLLLARLDQRGLSWQPERLIVCDLLAAVVDQVAPLAAAKAQTLRLDAPPGLAIDGAAEHVIRLLLNLLDNAIKYTPTGGTIQVRALQAGPLVQVVIDDTGPGIRAQHLAHLFERFYRVADDRARASGGAGLGLAIAHEIARWHGGSITVNSAVGAGTTFTVSLPSALQTDAA